MSQKSNKSAFPSPLKENFVTAPVMRFRHSEPSANLQNEYFATETAVALVYNGISHTVLMCTASHLEDLAVGFSLSEGIIDYARDIHDIVQVESDNGIELHIEIANRCMERLRKVRRSMAGRTGCGICGSESLDHVVRPLASLLQTTFLPWQKIDDILQQLDNQQNLNQVTGATHAAAYVSVEGDVIAIREDIGRHIALDKLVGYIIRHKLSGGAILVTSRASFEMVQKAVSAGVEILLAISAATSMAVELAQKSNLTLVGFCRPGRADAYTCPERIALIKQE
ncbi:MULTISPECIES: formate dehydrogenase accessory sulfurtransferase FdhD [Vibrio]|uniref:formate dehydrogenase accessory sulfurtransferase FdhD n=1 Tax=Vibrio TaxID=662 RepID=UPI000B5C1FFB|nr:MULTISPECIES: formate dehydrogenase accessory sulfurtransferase FdhD [Vibrio]HBV76109.1 formate dehydrogenase accessory sulfurtransferase FdhD [Vibrio sp.]